MTSAQRKLAKKAAQLHPEISCESYGFGQERQLHLFKRAAAGAAAAAARAKVLDSALDKPMNAVSVKNTFIDDWVANEGSEGAAEPIVLRSMPAQLLKNVVQSCILEGDSHLNLSLLKDDTCQVERQQPHLSQQSSSSNECSTAASSAPVTPTSSEGSPRDLLCHLPEPPGLEVRNTFIHFECSSSDQRVVQSMPHDMFRKCLMAEVLNGLKQERVAETAPAVEEDNELAPGTEVVIDGLLKAPAFNGQNGTVQSLDTETGRYNILLSSPAAGHKWAKVKRENLRMVLTPPPPRFAPTLSLDVCI
jgi:hypothetical protein